MRLSKPRFAPVPDDQWNAEQTALAAPMVARDKMLNIFRTLLNHPDAMRGFMGWGSYVLSKKNTLPARERELVVLRTGFLCRSGYEWTQHVPIGQRAGLTDAEIAAIKLGARDFIIKPFDTERVAATLTRLLSAAEPVDAV